MTDQHRCRICKKFQPLTEFYKRNKNSDKYDDRCRTCKNKRRVQEIHKQRGEMRQALKQPPIHPVLRQFLYG